MNTVSIGDIGESLAIAKFTKEGLTVSKPLSNNARYDLIVEFNNKLYKVQVKTTNSIKEGKMTFATKTTNYTKGNWASNAYSKDEVDIFFLYCVENEWCGLYYSIESATIPVELNIRTVPPKNGQKVGIRFAEEYAFDRQIKMLELLNA